MEKKRIFLIVLDSYGIGNAPDAETFGDFGANTLKSISQNENYATPNMNKIGLANIDGVETLPKEGELMEGFRKLQRGRTQRLDIGKLQESFLRSHCRLTRMDFQKNC